MGGMRIAIDARMMGAENTRGIGRYIEELVRAMLELAPEHRYILVTRTSEHAFARHPSVETVIADVPLYGPTEHIKMTRVFARIQPDIVHVMHSSNTPLFYGCPIVITVHDMLLRHHPLSAKASTRGPFMRFIKLVGYRLVMWRAIAMAKKILVPSQFVAQDVARFYPKAKDKIVITGEGMPHLDLLRTTHNALRTPFLLYVGSAYPHKGLDDLFTAWEEIAKRHPDLRLKIAGEKDLFMKRYEAHVRTKHLERIDFLDRVSESELGKLYADATALVYPSYFEGFGLPPLEAIAHGCPVISSDAGSLPEVLGKNSAIFFRAGDVNAILAAVESVLADPEKARQQSIQNAPKLALRHRWTEAAKQTLAAYGDSHFSCTPWSEE